MTTTEDPESLVNRIIAELEARPEAKVARLEERQACRKQDRLS